jgi:Sulfotransferase domain
MDEKPNIKLYKWIVILVSLVFLALINSVSNVDIRFVASLHAKGLVDEYHSVNSTYNSSSCWNASHVVSRNEIHRTSYPKIVWLMSFPNSGTTYTLKYVQGATSTTTATNYGATEQVGYTTSLPVNPAIPTGPFFRYPDRPYPTDYIMTKTHCEPHIVSVELRQFAETCRSGNRNINNMTQLISTYPDTEVVSAIHLIRNPFDNIVARMHYKQSEWRRSSDPKEQQLADFISSTTQGFMRWCQYLNFTEQKTRKWFNSSFWEEYMEQIPCAIDFYRYFHWHNLAVETIVMLPDPSVVLFYENYTTNFNTTTQELLNFLHLNHSKHSSPPEFMLGKTYPAWFTQKTKEDVRRLAMAVLSSSTWTLLQHYFDAL